MADNTNNAVAEKSKGWFKGLKSEFKRIVWESREDVTRQTIAVVLISLVLGIIITLIDTVLQLGIDKLISF
ncbi:MAG: preprotein translocase subunit SecE [Lachnospiraceae bacterium]|nr:preprotein translocase subunit SecE [Lachnospiraceae bacterium]